MAIMMMLVAAGLVACANYLMRRSIDAGGSTRAYLVVQLFLSFWAMVVLNPVRTQQFGISGPSVILGVVAGLLLGGLMWSIGRALEKGPPGLTFAVVNTSSVMPAVVMFFLFGAVYGHGYGVSNALGSVLVIVGLFWAGWQANSTAQKKMWVTLAISAFLFHVGLLVLLQWRALMLEPGVELGPRLPWQLADATSQWFCPVLFLVATFVQLISYLHVEKRWPNSAEVLYGVLGGLANAGGTLFLVKAPEIASEWENAMLFPFYAVSLIVLCNLWGQILYKEKVNWAANGLCLGGLAVGTIDWGFLVS